MPCAVESLALPGFPSTSWRGVLPCYNVCRKYCESFERQPVCRFFIGWMVAQPILTVLFSDISERTGPGASVVCITHTQGTSELQFPACLQPRRGTISKQKIYKSFRMIFFAHPHLLTPVESHSYKYRGRGWGGADFGPFHFYYS